MVRQVLAWGVMLCILLFIALYAINIAMTPAVLHTKTIQGESIQAGSALTMSGLGLRAEAWLAYPSYNIALGVIAIIAFLGVIYACWMMFASREVTNDTL